MPVNDKARVSTQRGGSEVVAFRVPPDLRSVLEAFAAADGVTLSKTLGEAAAHYVTRRILYGPGAVRQ